MRISIIGQLSGAITAGLQQRFPCFTAIMGPEHLQPSLNRHGISHTIAVQAAPTLAETDYLLALSDRTESIAGVVGFLDLFDPEHLSHFARFERHQRFVGFRVMIQELQNANVILQQTFVEALKEYEQRDTPIDLLLTLASA